MSFVCDVSELVDFVDKNNHILLDCRLDGKAAYEQNNYAREIDSINAGGTEMFFLFFCYSEIVWWRKEAPWQNF